jgi:hypothetical protein
MFGREYNFPTSALVDHIYVFFRIVQIFANDPNHWSGEYGAHSFSQAFASIEAFKYQGEDSTDDKRNYGDQESVTFPDGHTMVLGVVL